MKARVALVALFSVSAAAAVPSTTAPGTMDPNLQPPLMPAEPAPAPPPIAAMTPSIAPGPVTEVDRALDEVNRQERELKREAEGLGRENEIAKARTIARARAYVRLARAGLLPVGGGFQALVDHATKVERTRRALARDLTLERQLTGRRVEISKKLDILRMKRGPLEIQQRALSQARDALLSQQDRALAFQRAFESTGPGSHTAVYGAGV